MEQIYDRIGNRIDFKTLSLEICQAYELGKYQDHKVITVGIDDLSYYLWTSKGKYVVKNMNKEKTIKELNRFINQYDIIMKNDIKAPKLLLNKGKHFFLYETRDFFVISCVMECLEGKDLYTIGEMVTKEDIDTLISIILPVHVITEKIEIQYDEWNFMGLQKVYKMTKEYNTTAMNTTLENLMQEYKSIDFNKFPVSYIHGDLISTNVIKNKEGELSLIDFTSSGTGIRVLDLVKVITSLIFRFHKIEESKKLIKYFIAEYDRQSPLTQEEKNYLPLFIKADCWSCLALATYDKEQNNIHTEENEFWIQNDKSMLEEIEKMM